jgi:hypothetical protein
MRPSLMVRLVYPSSSEATQSKRGEATLSDPETSILELITENMWS